MDSPFQFDAPQFFDFAGPDNEKLDDWFEKQNVVMSRESLDGLALEEGPVMKENVEHNVENKKVTAAKKQVVAVPALKPMSNKTVASKTVVAKKVESRPSSAFGSSTPRVVMTPAKAPMKVAASASKIKVEPKQVASKVVPKPVFATAQKPKVASSRISSVQKVVAPTKPVVQNRPASAVIQSARKAPVVSKAPVRPATAIPASARKAVEKVKVAEKPLKLTIPVSPKFKTESRIKGSKELTFEERELARIQKDLEESKKVRERNSKNVYKVLASVGEVATVRSTQALTVPKEFTFKSTARLSSRPQTVSAPSALVKKTEWTPKLTVPKPFEFSTEVRAPIKPSTNTFVPLKVAVEQWSVSSSRTQSCPNSPMNRPKSLTVPVEFHFEIEDRLSVKHSNKEAPLTTEERVLMEIASIPAFKAQPVDDKVYHPEPMAHGRGISNVKLTSPHSPQFLLKDKVKEPEPEMPKQNLFEHSHGAKHMTIPKSPDFATKQRPKRVVATATPSPVRDFVARPIPASVIYGSKLPAKQPPALVVPEPFELASEIRGAKSRQMLMDKLSQEIQKEAEMREFRAKPILVPANEPTVVLTKACKLIMEAKQNTPRNMNTLENMHDENGVFRAQPLPKSIHEPFVPTLATKEPTTPAPFHCFSDSRAEKRKEFDSQLSTKEHEMAELRKNAEIAAKMKEDEEIKKLRMSLNFKARPAYHGPAFELKKNEKELTDPKSPVLHSKIRAASKVSEHQENDSIVSN